MAQVPCIGLYKPSIKPTFWGLCHVFLPSGSTVDGSEIPRPTTGWTVRAKTRRK